MSFLRGKGANGYICWVSQHTGGATPFAAPVRGSALLERRGWAYGIWSVDGFSRQPASGSEVFDIPGHDVKAVTPSCGGNQAFSCGYNSADFLRGGCESSPGTARFKVEGYDSAGVRQIGFFCSRQSPLHNTASLTGLSGRI
jgi:hypothetical protein